VTVGSHNSTHKTDEAGAVHARPATAEKAQDCDRAADENEDGRKFLEERQQPGRRDGAQQVDVDGRLRINMHPEPKTQYRAAAHLSPSTKHWQHY